MVAAILRREKRDATFQLNNFHIALTRRTEPPYQGLLEFPTLDMLVTETPKEAAMRAAPNADGAAPQADGDATHVGT